MYGSLILLILLLFSFLYSFSYWRDKRNSYLISRFFGIRNKILNFSIIIYGDHIDIIIRCRRKLFLLKLFLPFFQAFFYLLLVGFGWAKPVTINPRNFRDPKKGDILVSLAGPAANLITAFVALVVWLVLLKMGYGRSTGVTMVFQLMVIYNINFAIFNMIPLPPLDGSHILKYFLPSDLAYKFVQLERYSFLILIVLIWTPILHLIFVPAQRIIWDIFLAVLSPFFW